MKHSDSIAPDRNPELAKSPFEYLAKLLQENDAQEMILRRQALELLAGLPIDGRAPLARPLLVLGKPSSSPGVK